MWIAQHETVDVIGAHVRAAKTRKLLITERRRRNWRVARVCRRRTTNNTLHSDRTGTEAVAAATASTTTDNREVGRRAAAVITHGKRGRSSARAHTIAVDGVRGPVMSGRGREVRVLSYGAGGGHRWSGECGGRARHTLSRPAGWRVTNRCCQRLAAKTPGSPLAFGRRTASRHIIIINIGICVLGAPSPD